MESESRKENDTRARSFNREDYNNNRRVFLRSYPLHWGGEDEEGIEGRTERVSKEAVHEKKPIKKLIVSVFHWGEGQVLVLRRFKHKVSFYIIACLPVGFKSQPAQISA